MNRRKLLSTTAVAIAGAGCLSNNNNGEGEYPNWDELDVTVSEIDHPNIDFRLQDAPDGDVVRHGWVLLNFAEGETWPDKLVKTTSLGERFEDNIPPGEQSVRMNVLSQVYTITVRVFSDSTVIEEFEIEVSEADA